MENISNKINVLMVHYKCKFPVWSVNCKIAIVKIDIWRMLIVKIRLQILVQIQL